MCSTDSFEGNFVKNPKNISNFKKELKPLKTGRAKVPGIVLVFLEIAKYWADLSKHTGVEVFILCKR